MYKHSMCTLWKLIIIISGHCLKGKPFSGSVCTASIILYQICYGNQIYDTMEPDQVNNETEIYFP